MKSNNRRNLIITNKMAPHGPLACPPHKVFLEEPAERQSTAEWEGSAVKF